MLNQIYEGYRRIVLHHPIMILLTVLLLGLVSSIRFKDFRLDASSESLVLEGDPSLKQYRTMARRFGASDDFLLVTYEPHNNLFTPQAISTLRFPLNERHFRI